MYYLELQPPCSTIITKNFMNNRTLKNTSKKFKKHLKELQRTSDHFKKLHVLLGFMYYLELLVIIGCTPTLVADKGLVENNHIADAPPVAIANKGVGRGMRERIWTNRKNTG